MITLASRQFIIMATFFVLPLHLQTVLGFDALQTGVTILPPSVELFVLALAGASLDGKYSPKRVVEFGLLAVLGGEPLLLAFVGPDLRSIGFGVAFALVGSGLGFLASQLGNVITSSVFLTAEARPAGSRALRRTWVPHLGPHSSDRS